MENRKIEQLKTLTLELWTEEMHEYKKTFDKFGKENIQTKVCEARTNVIGEFLDLCFELWIEAE